MRKCMIVMFLPIAVPLLANPLAKTGVVKKEFCLPVRTHTHTGLPVKKPLPVREYANYLKPEGTTIGGNFSWFGSSPGDTIGCTQYDRQWNLSPLRRIVFDPNTGITHALWMHLRPTTGIRHMFYNCLKEGIWSQGQDLFSGIPVQEVPGLWDGYGAMDIDSAGCAIVALHRQPDAAVGYHTSVHRDFFPCMSSFTELELFPTAPGDSQTIWPRIAVDGSNNMVVVAHADSTIGLPHDYDKCWYSYSKDGGITWSAWAIVDTFSGLSDNIFASKKSTKVCIAWNKDFLEQGRYNGHMVYKESEDGGETWGSMVDAFDLIPTPLDKRYTFNEMKAAVGNTYGIYDSDDNIHLVTDASIGTDQAGYYFPGLSCVIWHYSEVKGLHLVATHAMPHENVWATTGWDLLYPYYGQIMAKPVISEDPARKWLYVSWIEFPYDTVGEAGYQSGEIYITYSFDGGEIWAPKLNLTMTPADCEVFDVMSPIINDTVRILYLYDLSGYDGLAQTPAVMDSCCPIQYLELPVTRGDVEVLGIVSPVAEEVINDTLWMMIDSGTTYLPKAIYKNNGTDPVSFQARFEICRSVYMPFDSTADSDTLFTPEIMYYDIKDVGNLPPAETTIVWFKPWTSDLGTPAQPASAFLNAYATFLVDTNLSNNRAKDIVGIEEIVSKPQPFALSQTYPNPAQRNANIKYSVPHTALVCLKVYDIAGKLVSTVVNKTCKPGTYTATWNGKTQKGKPVPTGIYFYRFVTDSYSATRKIVLLK